MTQHSNETLNESLSALVDGETSELELRRLLRDGKADESLTDRWARYQLAGAAARGELEAMAPSSFARGVSAALEREPAPHAGRRWWQRASQVAVAASVAGAVLLGVNQYPGGVPGESVAGTEAGESASSQNREPASLPSGYQSPSLPVTRPASAESGYGPVRRPSREVMFVPVRAGADANQVPVEEVRAYFDHLMRAHSDHAARNSNQGVLPFARVTAEEEE